jgi:sortase A
MRFNMKTRQGSICIVLGIVLLLVALSITLYNLNEDINSGKRASEVALKIEALLPEVSYTDTTTAVSLSTMEDELIERYQEGEVTTTTTTTVTIEDIPTVCVDGNYYLGIISIPSLGLELPILRDLSKANLKESPCLYYGSIQTGDIIICGHNYQSHFGNLQKLNSGDEIYITDTDGIVYRYEVAYSETINGYDVDTMKSNLDSWDLTLFTCTLSGQSRTTIRATKIL